MNRDNKNCIPFTEGVVSVRNEIVISPADTCNDRGFLEVDVFQTLVQVQETGFDYKLVDLDPSVKV